MHLLPKLLHAHASAEQPLHNVGSQNAVQAAHLVQMATKLTRLEELVMSRCTSLTLNAVQGFPAMTSLDLSHCEGLQPAAAVSSQPCNLFMCNTILTSNMVD